jgi:hypothetical protein
MTTVTLSDGRIAEIRQGKGKDAMAAQKIAGTEVEQFFSALMAQLVTIDGKRMPMEDFGELPLQDFLKIQGEIAGANFTSPAEN